MNDSLLDAASSIASSQAPDALAFEAQMIV
jgi:hypothetical protein